jgi:hypothetical protein
VHILLWSITKHGPPQSILVSDWPIFFNLLLWNCLAKLFQRRRFFRYRPIRKKNCLRWPCLLTNWDKMSNIHRGHSIDAFCQVSVHMAKQFQRRRFFRNRSIRNKNCMWWPCLLFPQSRMKGERHKLSPLSLWFFSQKPELWLKPNGNKILY